ncbi:hypothetical protein B0I35DRAFT_150868 [Stachybotrys elegans]|uniref:Uncharacterized protein n=1 Tax=Stachybotrys elegans TaxID=80388 RepID=A0A8K0SA42_9HYPO|nr:hypothetical protein B0I35DRAFT_150868 [Stachybotrys elegans]
MGRQWGGIALSGIAITCRLFRAPQVWSGLMGCIFAVFAYILLSSPGLCGSGRLGTFITWSIYSPESPSSSWCFECIQRSLMVSLIVELFFYASHVSMKRPILQTPSDYYRFVWWPVLGLTRQLLCCRGKCPLPLSRWISGTHPCGVQQAAGHHSLTLCKVNCALDVHAFLDHASS